MRALIQRVTRASVECNGTISGEIGAGLLVFVCAMTGDDETTAEKLAARIARLRIFRDEAGKMNRSVLDCQGAVLVVSQFTLAADMRSGNRPGFSAAAPPDAGARLYRHFGDALAGQGIPVQWGVFGGDMAVSLCNDGPVTIWMDSTDRNG